MATRALVTEEERTSFTVASDVVSLRTKERFQFIDITELVAERVRQANIDHGLVCVQTRHTTTAVLVNENEPLLLEDMMRVLERLAPRDMRYRHNDLTLRTGKVAPGERENGDAHCKAMLLGPSATLTIIRGKIDLGEWQSIFLVELDGGRTRGISILALGTRRDGGRHGES